jgi:hypothetical protein
MKYFSIAALLAVFSAFAPQGPPKIYCLQSPGLILVACPAGPSGPQGPSGAPGPQGVAGPAGASAVSLANAVLPSSITGGPILVVQLSDGTVAPIMTVTGGVLAAAVPALIKGPAGPAPIYAFSPSAAGVEWIPLITVKNPDGIAISAH